MLLERLTRVRERLDALREGRAAGGGLWERAVAKLGRADKLPPLGELARLDRELDRVGVHTAADARLLRTLAASKGKVAELAGGLSGRAERALDEYEARLQGAERASLAGAAIPGAASELERWFPKLARAAKVADLFALPEREGRFEIFARPAGEGGGGPPASPRLEIARFWADRAQGNVEDLFRKRRDLDAAHELLLRVSAGAERDLLRELRLRVSDARQRVRDLPAVRSLEELVRHVRVASRRDPQAAYRSLRGLYERAVEANDAALAQAAHAALSPLVPEGDALAGALDRAEAQALGVAPPPLKGEAAPAAEDRLAELAFDLDEERLAEFELAAGCARYFDVEDALSETVVEAELTERRPKAQRVPYPTQRMSYEATGSLHEHASFVLTDPRTVIYDLASNRQLVRAYLEEEPPPRPKRVKRTSVRVYVCDASGSMHGPRARFRDAILIAELNNLRSRARRGEPFDPLYFCFFNDRPTMLARVDSAAEATRQIEKLFGDSPAEGQTQITMALVAAFDAIRAARGSDPYLARATVVLVTDGEDRVDLELLRATRAPVGMLDIQLSFISLGEENPDLRSLIHEQRQKGGRAFYHHVSDAEIGSARSDFDSRFRTLLPAEVPVTPDALEKLLPQLEALENLARDRAAPPPPLDVAFDAVFPAPAEATQPARSGPEEAARIAELLDAIAEAASLAPAEGRGTESVTLLHHLLGVYALPLDRYLEQAAAPSAEIRRKLDRLRLVCRPFG